MITHTWHVAGHVDDIVVDNHARAARVGGIQAGDLLRLGGGLAAAALGRLARDMHANEARHCQCGGQQERLSVASAVAYVLDLHIHRPGAVPHTHAEIVEGCDPLLCDRRLAHTCGDDGASRKGNERRLPVRHLRCFRCHYRILPLPSLQPTCVVSGMSVARICPSE